MPLVSVIIAAHGLPDFLNEAVRSVGTQTFTDYEVIVVDDGSSEDVVARYRLPENARLIRHEKRVGAAAATRNTGLKAAGGDLIAFLDQDDMWLPDKLEAQVNALKSKSGVGLVFCHYTAVDESLRPLPEQRRSRRSVRNPLKKMVSGCFIRTPSTVLAKTRAVKECGMFDESVIGASDWDFYLRLARRYAFMAIPEPLVLYRMHQKQFHRDTAVMRSAAMRVMDKTLEWARSDRPDLRNHVERSYGRILRKAGRSQLVDECDSIRALDTLRKARKMRPWDILIHGLIMAAKFRRHRRTEGVK